MISTKPRVTSAGLGVVAGSQSVENAGGDRDDVLGRPRQLDADHVLVRVDAKPLRREDACTRCATCFVFRRGDRGGGKILRQLRGDVRAGERGKARRGLRAED